MRTISMDWILIFFWNKYDQSVAKIVLLVVFLFLPLIGFCQSQHAIVQGTVEVVVDTTGLFYLPPNKNDENPNALPSAIILLLDNDSSIVQGLSSNSYGKFLIDSISPGKYLLKVKHVGYEENVTPISLQSGELLKMKVILGKIYSIEELPFNERDARQDIEKGIVEFKWFNLIRIVEFVDAEKFRKAEAEARKKLGFSVKDISNEYENHNWHKVYQAVKRYNKIIDAHLSKVHGKNWREKFDKEVQKAYQELDGGY